MELVNAHNSRTVLTAANEGAIIATVEIEPYSLRNDTSIGLFQLRVHKVLCDSHQHNANEAFVFPG